ncbi:MAG: hypothetical protein LBL85_02385 [Methanocalculaceae archaeon]|jgi:hypothetical protein|nr:hypothetical protein [Methanocalculaceae archaeon]
MIAAKGDYIHIAGTASGTPAGVAVFIFGTNYYERKQPPLTTADTTTKCTSPKACPQASTTSS